MFENKEGEGCLKTILVGLMLIGSLTIVPVVDGYVFFKLWDWFIVSSFGVEALSLMQSVGLILGFNFLMASVMPVDFVEKDIEELIMSFLYKLVVVPLFYLLLGYAFSLLL